jgi:hypothetical protein
MYEQELSGLGAGAKGPGGEMSLFTKYKCPNCHYKRNLRICRYCNEERCEKCMPIHCRNIHAAVELAEAVLATVPAENRMLHRLARKAIRLMKERKDA